jgi:tetratricopeptide (TPR) repeat protein
MATILVRQGNELASSGNLADALEKYEEAIEVDPCNPDPTFQSGMCLMELGAYRKARDYYDETERLAPGWFRCRFDRWLADALDTGAVTDEEFRLLRILDDGGLPSEKAKPLALKAVADYPQFASFHLILGDIYRNENKKDQALACYRKGLEVVTEPDLESRLLCAAAGVLPVGSPERTEFVKRAIGLEGSLVAKAVAVFIPLQ